MRNSLFHQSAHSTLVHSLAQTTTNVANNDKGCKQRQRLQTTTKVAKPPSKSLYIGLPGRIVATWNGSTSACRVQTTAK
jgi:hypothetical protein